jgi:hypothetical protein
MGNAIYDSNNKLLIIFDDFTSRLKELSSHPLFPYENIVRTNLDSELISSIPYSIMPLVIKSSGEKLPAKTTYRAGSLESASIMLDRFNELFHLNTSLEIQETIDYQKKQEILNKLNSIKNE